jgi:hypothetical protein
VHVQRKTSPREVRLYSTQCVTILDWRKAIPRCVCTGHFEKQPSPRDSRPVSSFLHNMKLGLSRDSSCIPRRSPLPVPGLVLEYLISDRSCRSPTQRREPPTTATTSMQGVRPVSRRVIAQQPRRLLASFYDSQSGKHVDLPSGPQVHVGLEAVPTDRVSSALAHLLLKDGSGSPIKGLASISQRQLVATASDVETVDAKQTGIAITISDLAAGVAAVVAARERQLRPRAILDPALCGDAYAVQLNAAELGDAGAEAILLSPSADASEDNLREMAEMACEIDLEGIPMRSRLGLCFTKLGAGQLPLAKFAYEELELLHFYTCLAGKRGPRPSELLQALGVRPVDARYGPMYLAEHVPDAA